MGLGRHQSRDSRVQRFAEFGSRRGLAHPRDHAHEMRVPGATLLDITEPLESHMAAHPYRAVIGINSTALYLARQIYGPAVPVVSFGNDKVHFKNPEQRETAIRLMDSLGIERR